MLNAPPLPSSDPSYDSMKIQAAHSIAFYVDLNRLDLFLSSRVIAHKGRFLLCVSGLFLPFFYLLTGEQTYVESDSTYTASFCLISSNLERMSPVSPSSLCDIRFLHPLHEWS